MFIAFLFLLLSLPSLSFGSPNTKPILLEELIQTALNNNQEIISAEAMAQRYHSRTTILESLDDPLMAFYYFEFPLSRTMEQKILEGASLGMMMRSKLYENRIKMVKYQALWFELLSQDIRLQVIQKVKEDFYRLYFDDRIIAVNEENLSNLDGLIRSSKAQYSVGKVRQTEVLKLQTERAQLLSRILDLKQRKLERVADLSYLTSGSASQTIIPLVEPKLTPESLPKLSLPFNSIARGFSKNRPLLKGYQALITRFNAMKMMLEFYVEKDARAEAVKEANQGLRYIKAKAADFSDRVAADLKVSYDAVQKNQEQVKLYDEVILPQARQVYQASLADYQVGQIDQRDTLQALIDLNRYQALSFEMQANYMAELSKLELLSGMTLFGPERPSNSTDRDKPAHD